MDGVAKAIILFLLFCLGALTKNTNVFIPLTIVDLGGVPIVLSIYIQFLTFLYIVNLIMKSYHEIPEILNKDIKLYAHKV